ncbi:AMP-binding protein [Aliiroseovarius sp. YM-037]|uniref:AMP-binding protein n=1 Tax=Aliiroseovarius sp. YM-037 TaxID=3341728 RepID=UPI003A80E0DD
MTRRLLTDFGDWAATEAAFQWRIPDRFNMAEACCSSWARAEPDRVALRHLDSDWRVTEWTYAALDEASSRLANAFRSRGVRAGDRVGLLLSQGPEVLIGHFAAYKLGAIALPLFTLFGPDALSYRLADSGAKVAVTDGANLEKLIAVRPDLPALSDVYCTDPAPAPARHLWAEIESASPDFATADTSAEDPAVLIYTSGTTGAPKGALHAHRFLLGHLPSIEMHHAFFPQPGDCGWTPADWAWIGGLMDLAMPCLYYGVPLVSHRMRKFDPEAAYRLIREQGVRTLFLPPTALKLLKAAPVPATADVRTIASGGESLGDDLLRWGKEALGAEINELYGQTECNLVVSSSQSAGVYSAGTMGRAVPGHRVAVLDAGGAPAAAGELGEIAVQAPDPVMFLEYWNKPEETAAKFKGDWLMTGDLGTMDKDGYLTFSSRDDDVISSAGYRIGPSEIEHCLTNHPDVVMAAAIGVPDAVRGEVVKAFVVLKEGADWVGLEEALIERVKDRISPHVAPKVIERVADLPMTATGKIMRRKLRERP